uniref:Uncharacterized protein n=1 Tax=Triticum urartu TaxID=4572 RepID=A0A8R7PIM7_TRIUA
MQDARGRPQVRVQHVLPRLRQRRALLPVPRLPPWPPRHPDKEVLVPRRDPRVGDPEGAGHHRRADLHHQQRARRLPQRAPAAQARQGRHQHLRRLRAQPPRHLPLLLPRMQDRGHLRRVPWPEEARRRQEDEAEAEEGGGVGLRRLVHHHQRRERQEQRGTELLPVHPAGHRQQLPLRQAAQGHPAPVALRQPHRGVLEQEHRIARPRPPPSPVPTVAYTSIHTYLPLEFSCCVLFYTPRRRRRSLSKK